MNHNDYNTVFHYCLSYTDSNKCNHPHNYGHIMLLGVLQFCSLSAFPCLFSFVCFLLINLYEFKIYCIFNNLLITYKTTLRDLIINYLHFHLTYRNFHCISFCTIHSHFLSRNNNRKEHCRNTNIYIHKIFYKVYISI